MYNGNMHLADYMEWKRLSDEEVATAINISRVSVSRYRRKLVRPDWNTVERIVKWSEGKVTADDFLQSEAAE